MSASPAPAHPDRGTHLFIAAFSAALYSVLLIAPVVAGKLTTQFGLSPSQVGLLFSLELGAFSLATVPAYLWLRRVDLRTAAYLGLAGVVAGNLVSGLIDSFAWLVAVRFLTALAAGSITVIILSLGGRTADPGRSFGLFVVCQLAMGALILAVFPLVFADAPVSAVYWTLAGITALCAPTVRLIDGNLLRRESPAAPVAATGPGPRRVVFVLGLAAVLCFYIGLSAVWTFLEQIGTAAGNSGNTVSVILAVATVAGIASALTATVLGDSPRRTWFLAGGYVAMAISVVLLFGAPAAARLAIAAVVFKFAWTFILPYLLSALSELSSGGQVMNTTNLMIGTGFAIGPLLGGVLIQQAGGGFGTMLTMSLIGVLASMGLILAARPGAHSVRHQQPLATDEDVPA